MFLELGAAVKDHVLKNVPREGPIHLLTGEETDISVMSQLISFIQFFNKALGKTDTALLGIQDVLEEHNVQMKKTIAEKMEHLHLENGSSVESVGEFSCTVSCTAVLTQVCRFTSNSCWFAKEGAGCQICGYFLHSGRHFAILRELSCSRAGISTSPKLAPAQRWLN